jgi:glutamate racemase
MIGFFDSGIGGLTILDPVRKKLPEYDYMYLGDNGRAPYGDRSHTELVIFLQQGAQFLFERGCEIIIVACNSASAGALREVQRGWLKINFPEKRILGVIRPTVEKLASMDFESVLVLGTKATIKSAAYVREFQKLSSQIDVTGLICQKWASMIEVGLAEADEMKVQINKDLNTLKTKKIDAVLLGCTHYPYVKKFVKKELYRLKGVDIEVFEQGDLVAESLVEYLKRNVKIERRLSKSGRVVYFTTGESDKVSGVAKKAFGYDIIFEEIKFSK